MCLAARSRPGCHRAARDRGRGHLRRARLRRQRPALQRVWDDVAAYAPYYGSVHRGAGYLSQLSTDLFENARRTVAEFLGCRDGDQVVFTRSTTDSLNLLAAALPADCQVFVFETEHHASLLPWRNARVTYLDAPSSPRQAVETLERAPRRPDCAE
ncbi:hypothetical protein GCM10011428_38590 [Streptomyces violaceus]